MTFRNQDELLEFTKKIIGKKFKEIDTKQLLDTEKKDKGILGKIVETGFYGYELNSNPEADFSELGIELKVAGFKKNKNNTLSAKERLVLSKIDYYRIINEEFEFSKLLFKNKKLLIIWYEYDYNLKDTYGEFEIKHYQLYDMSIDEKVFKNDFDIIKHKVSIGEAHLLSEGDTSYLGACTKGSKSSDKTKQPNTIIQAIAKPRAFSLKNAYMTGVLRSIDNVNYTPVNFKTALSYIHEKLKPYFGFTQREIWDKVGDYKLEKDKNVPKNLNKMISDRIIGKDADLKYIDDIFNKTNYYIKNIPVDEKNYPLERFSFRNLRLSEFENMWKDSDWKDYFEEVTLIVVLYEGRNKKNGDRILKDLKTITFTSNDIDLFEKSYNMVRQAIKYKDMSKLPYPNSQDNQVLVISPKGTKGDNAYNNFFENDTTRTCFMLEKDFTYNKLK